MFQQQHLAQAPFHATRVTLGVFAVAAAVAVGAVLAVNLAATRPADQHVTAGAPVAIPMSNPRLNTGDSIDLQRAVPATGSRLNTGDSVDLQNVVQAAKPRLNTGDSIDLAKADAALQDAIATATARLRLQIALSIGTPSRNVQDFGTMPFVIAGSPAAPIATGGRSHFDLDSGR